jgi:hypothetical protein
MSSSYNFQRSEWEIQQAGLHPTKVEFHYTLGPGKAQRKVEHLCYKGVSATELGILPKSAT